ncbi:MAG: HAMP domain-containing protein [Nitrospirota bacterium]|nr:HAMP domain-containing protein [Nitrospirota bacterium]
MTAATTQQTFFHMLEQVRHLLEHQPPAEQIAALARLEQMLSQATTSIDTYRASRAARSHPTLFGALPQHQRTDLADLEDRAMEKITAPLSRFSEYQRTIATQLSRATPDKKLLSATVLQYERAILRSLHTATTTLIDVHRKIDGGRKLEGDHLVKEARLIVLALVSVLGQTIVFTCLSMRWSIAQPLHRLMATADRVAHHDLTAKVESWPNRDEVGTLATSLSSMVTSLRERTAALTHKTKELEAFTYTIAHDLKGPLREIEGFSSLLEKQCVDQGDPHVMHYIDVIRKSSLRLTHMIDALLKYSRLEQQDLPRARFNLLEMISSLLVDRQSQLAGITPQITVNLHFADLYGESVSIRQALVYLLDNALKFSRYSLAQTINIGGQQTPTEPIFWIQDNDIGFDVGQKEKLFGLFERLHNDQEYEGTGVGLAIVKMVADKYEGRIWAESSPWKGSMFYLAFPNSGEAVGRQLSTFTQGNAEC